MIVWSSDVCSPYLRDQRIDHRQQQCCRGVAITRVQRMLDRLLAVVVVGIPLRNAAMALAQFIGAGFRRGARDQELAKQVVESKPGAVEVGDRKSVVSGKSVSVRVGRGGRRRIK